MVVLRSPRLRALLLTITAFAPGAPLTFALFPYTTLFRSHGPAGDPRARLVLARRACGHERDRKSTRLNSSHVAISYAVFCLKNKVSSLGLDSGPLVACRYCDAAARAAPVPDPFLLPGRLV